MFHLDKIVLSLFISVQMDKIFQNKTYELSKFNSSAFNFFHT